MKHFVVLFMVLFSFLITTSVDAQAPCTVIYGGGQNNGKSYCVESAGVRVTPTPTQPARTTPLRPQGQTDTNIQQPQGQTKGGMVVQPAPTTKTQPATGPESLALLGMIPVGIMGYYLRRKTA